MKIKLKNVGTLKQAEIDLSKDLIILAGPNNTGKTYAAYTVYGVCNLLRKSRSFSIMDNQTENDVIKYFNNFKNGRLEINIIDLFNSLLLNLASVIDKITVQQLENVFAPNTNETFKDSNIQILEIKENVIDYLTTLSLDTEFSFSTILTHSKRKIHLLKKSDNLSLITSIEDIGFGEKYTIFDFSEIVSETKNYIFERIVDLYFNNLYISTAERSAINIFSKELSIKRNTIVDQLLELRESKNGVTNQLLDKLQRYSLPIRDSLEIAEDLANLSRNKSEYAFLADKMEEVLLDGKINISKYGEVQYSPNKSKVKNLSMNLSGSIVKSLSSLVIYFRHLAKKNDFIIIDEPELNLHPDNQRKITRLIGEFVNQGFKVMISTHSDYIIRELNNMTMLKIGGEKAEYLANKYGYKTEQLIDYQKIGAYLFHKNKNISLEVTEIGFEVGTIDEEINNLNNASEEIYFTLFD